MKTSQSTTDTAAPKASHDASGWRRRGEYSKSRATEATANASPSGQRAIRQIASNVSPQVERVANGGAAHEHHQGQQREQPSGQRQPEADQVLPRERPVALDAVDAVRPALDLPHRRCAGHERRDPTGGERRLA